MYIRYIGVLLSMLVLICLTSGYSSAKLLFHDDFEKDTIGSEPTKWAIGFAGDTKAEVIVDPQQAGNKILKTSTNPVDDSRHDVGGSIYVVGDDSWDDYVAEWDMMFPEDFYMGVVFRFQDGEKFYLCDRRQGGSAYIFYKRQGNWAEVQPGSVNNQPNVWYRAQLTLSGDNFTFKLKERKDNKSFDSINPAIEGQDGTFETGKFGNYGLVLIDNLFIGDKVEDLVLSVDPQEKLSTTWGVIKSAY